ncbi:hypothetical protein [Pseudoalteromonas phage J2-1_QLiu-2017]|nr:hypothetical protein [Pseudoalteromonas phage J2-1_QLiu-2017]
MQKDNNANILIVLPDYLLGGCATKVFEVISNLFGKDDYTLFLECGSNTGSAEVLMVGTSKEILSMNILVISKTRFEKASRELVTDPQTIFAYPEDLKLQQRTYGSSLLRKGVNLKDMNMLRSRFGNVVERLGLPNMVVASAKGCRKSLRM